MKKSFECAEALCDKRRINNLHAHSISERGFCRSFSTPSVGFESARMHSRTPELRWAALRREPDTSKGPRIDPFVTRECLILVCVERLPMRVQDKAHVHAHESNFIVNF